ncbi:unnamed protein product [Caenorhabditis auriculariae]|uniref:Uncharacterized protein n=1 Tax=Caenorhabditis auriculariae TaxID=2777116 RepID=A0A8S1HV94_9PELO|nr:unnamed protein product [Caenorhabditis auriculariae]
MIPPCVAIDFGTFSTKIAIMDESVPILQQHPVDGLYTISLVAFEEYSLRVGLQAKNSQADVIKDFKKKLGKTGSSGDHFGYDVTLKNKLSHFPVELIVSLFLDEVINLEEQLFERVIVTVPMSFDAKQRQALMTSLKISGIEDAHLIEESTAAVIEYIRSRPTNCRRRHVVVVSFGAGFFEAALIRDVSNNLTIMQTDHLEYGGADITEKLFDKVLPEFKSGLKKENLEEWENRFIWNLCDEGKSLLSLEERALLRYELIGMEVEPVEVKVSREELNRLIEEDVEALMKKIRGLLNKPISDDPRGRRLQPDDVNELILVGGSSKVHLFREQVRDFFKMAEVTTIDEVEAAVFGAAVFCKIEGKTLNDGGVLTILNDTGKIKEEDAPISMTKDFVEAVELKGMLKWEQKQEYRIYLMNDEKERSPHLHVNFQKNHEKDSIFSTKMSTNLFEMNESGIGVYIDGDGKVTAGAQVDGESVIVISDSKWSESAAKKTGKGLDILHDASSFGFFDAIESNEKVEVEIAGINYEEHPRKIALALAFKQIALIAQISTFNLYKKISLAIDKQSNIANHSLADVLYISGFESKLISKINALGLLFLNENRDILTRRTVAIFDKTDAILLREHLQKVQVLKEICHVDAPTAVKSTSPEAFFEELMGEKSPTIVNQVVVLDTARAPEYSKDVENYFGIDSEVVASDSASVAKGASHFSETSSGEPLERKELDEMKNEASQIFIKILCAALEKAEIKFGYKETEEQLVAKFVKYYMSL